MRLKARSAQDWLPHSPCSPGHTAHYPESPSSVKKQEDSGVSFPKPSPTPGGANRRRQEQQQGNTPLLWAALFCCWDPQNPVRSQQVPAEGRTPRKWAVKAARNAALPSQSDVSALLGPAVALLQGSCPTRKQATPCLSLHFFTCEEERTPAWCGDGGRFAPGSAVALAPGGRGESHPATLHLDIGLPSPSEVSSEHCSFLGSWEMVKTYPYPA